jgi:hypothetical protein
MVLDFMKNEGFTAVISPLWSIDAITIVLFLQTTI